MPDQALDPMTLAMLSGDPDALKTMRQYALAQQLQQMSLGGPTQPQQFGLEGKYPHAARIGGISAVAPLIEALMSRQGFKTAGPAMSQMMGAAYGVAPQTSSQPSASLTAAPPGDPNSQDVQPLIQRTPGQNFAQTVAGSQPQSQPWYSVPGLPDNAARLMAFTNRGEWAKLKLGPESWQQLVRGFGGNEAAAASAVQAKAMKEGTIEARSGSTSLIPQAGGGYQNFTAPDPARGEQYSPDIGGGIQASPIAGSSDIQAQRAQDLKRAQEAVTPHYEPDPFHPGQTHIVYPQGPNPPVGRYFPPSSGTTAPVGGTAANLEQQKKGAESGQAYSDELNKNAENATELRASLAELKNLAKAGGISASNPAKLELGSYLIAAGMDPDAVGGMLHTDVGALVAASKQTGNLAINSIHKFTSRGSNFDLATFMRYNPNLDMGSQAGFQRVVDFMDRRLQQDVAKQADFDHWSQNQPPDRWASGHSAHWLGLQNKLISMGATNSGAAPITPEDIAAEKARRGLQ